MKFVHPAWQGEMYSMLFSPHTGLKALLGQEQLALQDGDLPGRMTQFSLYLQNADTFYELVILNSALELLTNILVSLLILK